MHESGLSGEAAREMASWGHNSGFSLDASVRIEAKDRAGLERLLRYCARPVFASQRLSWAREGEKLLYQLPKPRADGQSVLELTPVELLGRLAALIPPPRRHRHRYHGVLAPNARLRALVTAHAGRPLPGALEPPSPRPAPRPSTTADEPTRRSPASYLWVALLARISAIAPALLYLLHPCSSMIASPSCVLGADTRWAPRLPHRAGLGETHSRPSRAAYRASAGRTSARAARAIMRLRPAPAPRPQCTGADAGVRIRPTRELVVDDTPLPEPALASSTAALDAATTTPVPEQAPRPNFTFPKTVCAPLHTRNPHPTANRFSSRHHSSAQNPSKSLLKTLSLSFYSQ